MHTLIQLTRIYHRAVRNPHRVPISIGVNPEEVRLTNARMGKAWFVALLLMTSMTTWAVERPIADTFTLDGKSRAEGSSLDGLTTEQGAAIWQVSDNAVAVFTSKGSIRSANHLPVQAQVAMAAPTRATTVQVDVVPEFSDWAAVAFHSTAKTPDFFDRTREAQIWLMFRPSGRWQLWQQGTSKSLRDGSLPHNINASQPHALALTYDPAGNTVTAKIDDQTVVTALPLGDFKPQIHAAGFRINVLEDVDPTDACVDNFKLETAGQ